MIDSDLLGFLRDIETYGIGILRLGFHKDHGHAIRLGTGLKLPEQRARDPLSPMLRIHSQVIEVYFFFFFRDKRELISYQPAQNLFAIERCKDIRFFFIELRPEMRIIRRIDQIGPVSAKAREKTASSFFKSFRSACSSRLIV